MVLGEKSSDRTFAIFFDRDNTLIVNDGYLGNIEKIIIMPGAAAAVARAKMLGFAVLTVSNQSGVARGMFDESAVEAVDRRMDELLLADNPEAKIDLHLYCPFHPQAVVPRYRQESDLRKPAPGMLLLAARQFGLDLRRSWMIGDSPRDVEAGSRAGCRTILFSPRGVSASPAATDEMTVKPDYHTTDLIDAISIVEQHRDR